MTNPKDPPKGSLPAESQPQPKMTRSERRRARREAANKAAAQQAQSNPPQSSPRRKNNKQANNKAPQQHAAASNTQQEQSTAAGSLARGAAVGALSTLGVSALGSGQEEQDRGSSLPEGEVFEVQESEGSFQQEKDASAVLAERENNPNRVVYSYERQLDKSDLFACILGAGTAIGIATLLRNRALLQQINRTRSVIVRPQIQSPKQPFLLGILGALGGVILNSFRIESTIRNQRNKYGYQRSEFPQQGPNRWGEPEPQAQHSHNRQKKTNKWGDEVEEDGAPVAT